MQHAILFYAPPPFFFPKISVLNSKGERTLEKVHVARHRAGIRPKFADEDEDSSDVSNAVQWLCVLQNGNVPPTTDEWTGMKMLH